MAIRDMLGKGPELKKIGLQKVKSKTPVLAVLMKRERGKFRECEEQQNYSLFLSLL